MNVEIAERLAKRRREAGFSQEDLAARLSVSRQAVSKWERSESSPDTDNLIALAKIYGVSLDELLYVDDAIEEDVSYEAIDRGVCASACVADEVGAASAADQDVPPQVHSGIGDQGNTADAAAADPAETSEEEASTENVNSEKSRKDYVHIGPAGIHIEDGEDSVHISWSEGVHVLSSEGDQVHVDWRGIHVSDPRGSAGGAYGEGAARRETKPLKIAALIGGLYPLAAMGWFLWMAFAQNAPHPAWVIFVTIPFVEWVIFRITKFWNRR
ncbi:MAG: helix-turn-helix transcriptional regulator [Raoultibacter sp.]